MCANDCMFAYKNREEKKEQNEDINNINIKTFLFSLITTKAIIVHVN